MPRQSAYRDRIVRRAALTVILCAIIIFGFTCIMMQSTVWNRPEVRSSEPFYTTLPGVDLSGVPPDKLPALLKGLNTRRCTCGCLRTVAGCRNHHGTCSFSVAVAKEAAREAK